MRKVVLVEDNPDNRLLVQALLEDHFDIRDYESGVEAIPGIVNETPDLVLMDISLPEMDGEEVLAKLREHEHLKNLPVIALTAHAMAGDREKFLEQGFDDYMTKPIVDEAALISMINGWIEKRQID